MIKRFRILRAAVVATLVTSITAIGFSGTVRLATLAPKDTSFEKSLKRMGQTWRTATGGRDRLMVYAGGSQGNETSMIQKMEINRIHAALLTGVGLAEIDPGVAVLQQVPLLYRNFDELEHVMEQITPVFEKRMREKGFVVLSWLDAGWVHIYSKKTIATPDDMRDSKLYTWAGDPEQTDLLKKMGFRPVPIDATDIVPSLSTGLIDTVPLPPFFALAQQSYNQAPNMLDINYTPIIGAVVVTKSTWDKYDDATKAKLREAAQLAASEMRESGRKESEESVDVMVRDWGLKVTELDEDLSSKWEAISEEAYTHIRDKTVPAEIWDQVIEILEKYRAEQG